MSVIVDVLCIYQQKLDLDDGYLVLPKLTNYVFSIAVLARWYRYPTPPL